MCGIAGGINSGLSEAQAKSVLDKLFLRGPDDSGLFMKENVWLGNTRLAIQDRSSRGHQPMLTPDGRFTIVFNGEIYNHWELRLLLMQHGVIFRSDCDTETLLYAYAIWGEACLEKLDGDFAFAVFDSVKNELLICRDRMGVKPLYIYQKDEKFLFASSLKALMGLPFVDYTLQPEIFFYYLLFQYCPSADTPYKHVKKLLPAHCIRISAGEGKAVHYRYDSIPFTGKYESRSEKEWKEITDRTLKQSVSNQLHADVPVGITLSGGLDSSLIAAMIRAKKPDGSLHAFCVNTHGAMKEEGFEDDFVFARRISKRLGIELHEVSGKPDMATELDTMIWHLDEPQADPAALHMLHISAAANAMGIKVLLSGAGADDIFSGYRRHQSIPFLKTFGFIPSFFSPIFQAIAGQFPKNTLLRRGAKLAAGAGLPLHRAMIHTHFWADLKQLQKLFNPGILSHDIDTFPYRIYEQLLDEIPDEKSALNKMLFLDQRTFLPQHNLAYMDKLGMAHSVEVRVPFLSRKMVALAASMPPEIKLRRGVTKDILRKVAADYLPNDIVHRSKTGFGAPLRHWMKNDLRPLVHERLTDTSFLSRNIFSRESIEALIGDNRLGKTDGSYTLFSLLSIESWMRQFTAL